MEPGSDVESLKKVAKGAGFVFVSMIISKVISYFYYFFVARGLGPEGYGMIEIGISVISFVWVFASLGLTMTPGRYAAYYKGRRDTRRLKGSIQACIIMLLPLGIISAVLLFVISPIISPIVTSNPAVTPEMSMILRILSIAIPFTMLNAVMRVSLRGLQNMKHSAYAEYIIFNSVQLMLVLAFLFIGWDVFGVALAYLISTVVTTGSFFYFLQRKSFPIISKIKSIRPYKEMLLFSLPLFLGSVSVVFLSWTDTLFIGVLKDASWSGIYNAALPLAGMIFIIERSFSGLIIPIVTEMDVKKQGNRISRFYKDVTNWIFYAGLPFLLLLMLFSKNALNFVFGDAYMAGAQALSILALGYFTSSIFSGAYSILFAMKKTKHLSMNNMAGAALNVVLNFLLIPAYGIAGAAVATTISVNVTNLLATFQVWRLTGMQPLTARIFRSLLAGLVSISFIYILTETFWEYVPIPMIIALFFLFIGLYLVLLLAFGTLQKSDIVVLKAFEEKLGIRIKWLRELVIKLSRVNG